MKDGLRVLAVVPARGGSDTVPYLNIKRLGDCPLLAHTLNAARNAPSVDRLIVSTDDPAVAEVAREQGAEVPFLRPKDLAADIPSLKPVIVHAVRTLEDSGQAFDIVVVLQATSPFREADAVEAAVGKLVEGGFDAVISVSEDRTLNWHADGDRLLPLFTKEGRREEQPPVYKENGAVVVLRREVLDGPSRFGERVGFVALDKRSAFTVHDLEDFWMAERLLRTPRVLFRVDGGGAMGMGHVYRSLAIADALREVSRAEVGFLMTSEHGEGPRTVSGHGYPVRLAQPRLPSLLEHIRDFAPAILINDLPSLDEPYLRALSHLGTTTVNLVDTLDDLATTEHYAQVIVSVMKEDRETPEGFYGGPAYAILRDHFRGKEKEIREVPRLVLLSFGGSDPQGLTVKAAAALGTTLPPEMELLAVAGPAFAFRREFESLAHVGGRKVPLINEAGGHIADLMLAADVVVGSGGMSVYELAALGTPGIVLGQNAREDARMRAFASHGTIEYLGLGTEVEAAVLAESVQSLLADVRRRRTMSDKGRTLVDGLGATRAAEMVLEKGRQARGSAARVR